MSHGRDLIQQVSEKLDPIPRWQRAIGRAYNGYLAVRYRDPIQRQAQAHLHNDLTFMDSRIASFASASRPVQQQVIRQLHHSIEYRKPGNSSPALSGLVAVIGTTITLIGAIYLAIYNGWFGLLAALTDPSTGQVHGLTASQSDSVVGGLAPAILGCSAAFVGVGLVAFWAARNRDRERATCRIWLEAYKKVLANR